ncbi:MAG: hypothetical protein ABJC12_12100 [Saprospiraceae bacterium]
MCSQDISNPYIPQGRPIECELGILPSSESYVLTIENYLADKLVDKHISESFYNYGNIRYVFENNGNWFDVVDRVRIFKIINDTLSIQTSLLLDEVEQKEDSMLIYSKNGKIYLVDFKENGNEIKSIALEYDDDKLVKKFYTTRNKSSSVIYSYHNDLIDQIISLDFNGDSVVSNFAYSDTLISKTTSFSGDHFRPYVLSITRIDKDGNLVSTREYDKYTDIVEPKLIKTTSYEYQSNKCTVKRTFNWDTNFEETTTTCPNEDTITKMEWKNENKVRLEIVRRY